MPEDYLTTAGNYRVHKQFRDRDVERKRRDMPWSKKILNMDKHTLFQRTVWGWTRIVCFYLVLYFLIATILILMITIFYFAFGGFNKPQCLKGAPGVSMVPKTKEISYNVNVLKEIYPYADEMDDFMETLGGSGERLFNECNKDKLWGYRSKVPSIFIKLNKVIGFKAKTYNSVDELPRNKTPTSLKRAILMYPGKNRIWITCEATIGSEPVFKFLPGPYYDASNGLQGNDRIVALQITDLPNNKELLITCKVWAKNIDIDEKFSGWGNIRFRIHMFDA